MIWDRLLRFCKSNRGKDFDWIFTFFSFPPKSQVGRVSPKCINTVTPLTNTSFTIYMITIFVIFIPVIYNFLYPNFPLHHTSEVSGCWRFSGNSKWTLKSNTIRLQITTLCTTTVYQTHIFYSVPFVMNPTGSTIWQNFTQFEFVLIRYLSKPSYRIDLTRFSFFLFYLSGQWTQWSPGATSIAYFCPVEFASDRLDCIDSKARRNALWREIQLL